MTRTRIVRTIAATVVAACLAFAPLPAGAATAAKRPQLRLSLEQARAKGPSAVQAFEVDPGQPLAYIEGHVGNVGGMRGDALPIAFAFVDFGGTDGWQIVAGTEVAEDGSYSLEVMGGGEYRVGIVDDACVYQDAFYDGAVTVDAADTITLTDDQTLTGIDITMTPRPENIVSGTVDFTGAAPVPGTGEDYVLVTGEQFNVDWDGFEVRTVGKVQPDGTYRLHLPEPGAFKVGFHDYTGVFTDVYYHDAPTADEAADVSVSAPADSKSGIDQTMTAVPSKRIEGTDRYETAVAVSQFGYAEGEANTVVLATGENWPDAISGSVLASRNYGPLLLTRKRALPESVADELRRLQPFEVVIVGSPDAVSLDVEIALRTEFNIPLVWRLAGRDRYETAALVAETMAKTWEPPMGPLQSEPATPPIVVASGEKFPDAMSAAPLAANAGSPVLLVRRDSVPPSVQGFLGRHGEEFSSTLVIGGGNTVATSTANAFPGWDRIAGINRYDTAAKVAEYGIDNFGMSGAIVGVACGTKPYDGLASIPVLASEGQPLLLTDPYALSPATGQFLVDHGTSRAYVFGSEGAISPDVFDQILDALGS